jgi:hypothetical protein
MTIHGVQIKFPHSGEVSRSVATRLLMKEVKKMYSGRMSEFDFKKECQRINTLWIEDVNYSYRTSLS